MGDAMTRRRFLYRPGHPAANERGFIEASQDYEPAYDKRVDVVIDRHHWGTKAPDGTDIGSKTKRRNYLKMTGYAEADDYRPDYSQRVQKAKDHAETKSLREAVARTFYQRFKP